MSNPFVSELPTSACQAVPRPGSPGPRNPERSARPLGGIVPPARIVIVVGSRKSVPNGGSCCGIAPGTDAASSHWADGAKLVLTQKLKPGDSLPLVRAQHVLERAK